MTDNPSKNSGSNNGNSSSQPKQLQLESKNSESSETKGWRLECESYENSSSGNNANNNDTSASNVTTVPATEISKIGNTDGSGNTPDHTLSNQPLQSQTTSQNQSQPQPQLPPPPSAASFMLHPNNSSTNMSTSGSKHDTLDSQSKQAKKKISKQNSTKTDFFAARLASAVDDIESSDSDETFVYENNDNGFDSNNNNNNNTNNTIDNASVSGSIAAPAAINGSTSGGALRTPSIFEGEQLLHYYEPTKQPFKLPSNKAPSIANSINSNNNNLDSLLKRPAHLRELSGYSTNDNDARASLPPAISDRLGPASPSNLGYENMPEFQRNSSIAHSINEGYNDDTFSYNEVEDDLVDEVSTDDGEIGRSNNNTLIASSNQQPAQQQQSQQHPQLQQQLHPQSSSQHLQAPPSVTPSLSTKNTSKKNYKSSTSSSKLRTTASKLFDKKGSQPRRYSTIPDDIDIEDLDEDEFMYYDNNVRFPANETSSLLKNQRIPHYRSLNLNYPIVKRQNKRYLSTGQPLESSDHGSAKDANVASNNNNGNNVNNGNRVFPFPYQDQLYNYYYDYDDFDQESQRYSPNFDLPDLPLNRAASRNFNGNTLPQNRFGNSHFFLPRKTDQNNSRSSFCKSCIYMFLSLILVLVVGFMFGFVLATTKDLTDVGITSIENPIVSKDELVFNIVVEAFNPGWFSVDINEVELDLFARSGYLPDDDDSNDSDIKIKTGSQKVETVKLGTILNLENPMTFKGGIISREPTVQKGEVKLLDPGKNITVDALLNKKASDDNSKKWEIICANPFDLIITGVLKYDLPFARTTRSVVVRKTGYIDPTLFVIPQEGMTL
ncbi:hypothetical protein Cantr_05833 [Candida viswanathii]|uniref:Vacuolar segregation protein 7 n=1 Tax=Candida viswanathii TaxID=5486 RepID=A0A367XSK5_9ASCO|nr:hypothetical protein Cantr_05833 [Candida viswanathii]